MLARRSFLAFLGLGAGAAAAVKVSSVLPAAAPSKGIEIAYGKMPIFRNGDKIYQGTIVREVDCIYGVPSDLIDAQREYNRYRSECLEFYSGPQWTAVKMETRRG